VVDVLVHIAAKLFRFIGGGTNIELAFVDEEDRWIDIPQFAFSHVVCAIGSVLRNISGRILVKRSFVGRGSELIDRTPETALDRWFTFDGLVPGKIGNWIVSLQNYAVAVDVYLGLLAGLRGFFRQNDDAAGMVPK
jgi:hypothetical protein